MSPLMMKDVSIFNLLCHVISGVYITLSFQWLEVYYCN